jgi:hypothetical protein
MADAARLLPLVGLFLVLLPVLWHPAETPEPDTTSGGVYLFAVWLILIIAAFFLARLLSGAPPRDDQPDEDAR